MREDKKADSKRKAMEAKAKLANDTSHNVQEWLNGVANQVKKGVEFETKANNSPLVPFNGNIAGQFDTNVKGLKQFRTELECLLEQQTSSNTDSADWDNAAKAKLKEAKKMSIDLTKHMTGFEALHRIHYPKVKVKSEKS